MKKRIQKFLAGEREGFSLVELIIVIAIMAILIGVIALAVLPNIQRSRESKDIQALDSIASAANAAIATTKASGKGVITLGDTKNGVQDSTGTDEGLKIAHAIYDTVANGAGKTESDAATGTIKVAYDVSSKKIKVAIVAGTPSGSTTVSATTTYADITGAACKYLDGKFEVNN